MAKIQEEDKKQALSLARETIEKHFGLRDDISLLAKENPFFKQKLGLFVTIKKDGELRGCIGTIWGAKELTQEIPEMALAAALYDERFPEMTREEVGKIKIEISILTEPVKAGFEDIELGRHGVIMKKGMRTGVFLPQVAEETGWNKEEFLSHLCHDKAGLSRECYLEREVEIYIFEAIVFSE